MSKILIGALFLILLIGTIQISGEVARETTQENIVESSKLSSSSFCVGDLNLDGVVDAGDLALLLGSWGNCAGCPADIAGSGDDIVGPEDLSVLLGNWGECDEVPSLPLIAHWKFDEGTGNIAYDETSNNNDGNINGATWTSDSISGYALDFNGIDDRIDLGNTPSLISMDSEIRIEASVKRQSSQDGTIVSRNGPYLLAIQDNKVAGAVFFGGGPEGWTQTNGATNLNLNKWYDIAMEYDGSAVKVYVDGVLDGSVPETRPIWQDSHPVFIGWGEPGVNQYFTGIIDEVKIYGV